MPAPVTLQIYDIAGRLTRTLIDRPMDTGTFTESWDGRDDAGDRVASGVYFCRLKADNRMLTRKMLLLK